MPIFKFRNNETGEEFEDLISNAVKEELLAKNPHIEQVPTGFAIVTQVGSVDSKTDDTWKEVLAKVAESHPDSVVGKRYGKRSIKKAKTDRVVEKWRNR